MQKLLSRRSALFGILTCSRAAEGNVCDHFDSANPPGVEGFDCEVRTVGDRTHSLYWKGSGSGPAVFVLHEIPGLYRADIDLARRIEKQGFTVFVPLFFGRPGECHPKRNLLTKPLNPGSEFSYWLPSTPRAARWLEPQLEFAFTKSKGKGVALIGMCLTGSLPLAVISSPLVKAAVLCQPNQPISIALAVGPFV
jgi:dienelactone hydrolase